MAVIDAEFALNPAFRSKITSAVVAVLNPKNPIRVPVRTCKTVDDKRDELDSITIDLFWANDLIGIFPRQVESKIIYFEQNL